ALRFHTCNGLVVDSLTMTNSPGGHISLNGCDGAKFSHINITAPRQSPNTDGFDIAVSKNILIEDSTIGVGDDCIAINGGTSYINATRVVCGPGHGISIGSLGRNNSHETVEEVHVQNCSFIGTTNGARIKTWPVSNWWRLVNIFFIFIVFLVLKSCDYGGSGYARKISFEEIILSETENPIIIDQNYGIKTLDPKDGAVEVSEVTYRWFKGTCADGKAIDLKCSTSGCFNVTLDEIYIVSSQPSKPAYAICKNAHGTVGKAVPNVSCILPP
ncbi:putative polygalacturonase, partial [Mucuna pruriens]